MRIRPVQNPRNEYPCHCINRKLSPARNGGSLFDIIGPS